ncbi:MAG: octaprenyl diphosphate synthase [Salinisphaeraceae bacterium]|nr:octaprenyl diphosphate synthase [Salinisphaeraceae bacterium]
MNLKPILEPVQADMDAVNRVIRERLSSDVVLINQLGDYIISAGGKRLRPATVLLAARASGYEGDEHVLLAAIVEFIHTATLLHDDVVDESDKRRGRDTANHIWGNGASVLTGDFLYSRSFQMMVELERPQVMEVLADTTNRIAEGEVMQLLSAHNADLAEADYLEVTDRKTASLFSAGCRLGALLAASDEATQQAMADFGQHLGVAFQVTDDALDYQATGEEWGKNLGDDLAEGKATLPLIRAMAQSTGEQRDFLRKVIEDGDLSQLAAVQKAIESTDALAYTCARAEGEADAAKAVLASIPDSPSKSALLQLADFACRRSH